MSECESFCLWPSFLWTQTVIILVRYANCYYPCGVVIMCKLPQNIERNFVIFSSYELNLLQVKMCKYK